MRNRHWKTYLQYELLVAPALLLYIIFCGFPFVHTFFYSVTNFNKYHVHDYHWVGLQNYIRVFGISMLRVSLLNSIRYAFFMTLFQSLAAIPLAVLLNRKLKLRNFYRMLFFLPAMFSPLVVGYLWKNMLAPAANNGLINQLLLSVGAQPIAFLSSANALNSIIFSQVWQWTGWAMVIYLANLQNISDDVLEAARIDGANEWRIFFSITLPHLYPGVTVVTISSLVGGLKVFDIVQSMTGGGPGYATETIMGALIKTGFSEGNYALAAAFGVVFFVVVMLISTALLRGLKLWERKVEG